MKNKTLLVLTIAAVSVLAVSALSFAQTDNSSKTVDGMMQQIMSEQHVAAANQIDCSKVSNDEFEQLGDAVMERMIENHQLHEQMDAMMGGEGSQSLTQMHTAMGENWLGCSKGSAGFQGMMGSGGMMGMMPMMMNMMGGNMMSGQTPQTNMMQGMMGNWGYFGYWNFMNVLYVILLIGLIILVYLGIIKLWKSMKNKEGKK